MIIPQLLDEALVILEQVEGVIRLGALEIENNKLNEIYNKWLTHELNPDAEDFKEDLDDVHKEHGKSDYLSDCNFCL
jgi:hypothetical protein